MVLSHSHCMHLEVLHQSDEHDLLIRLVNQSDLVNDTDDEDDVSAEVTDHELCDDVVAH